MNTHQDHMRHVRIHIDREPYESPTPTSGEALYALGRIPAHRDLFREVDGNQEDERIDRHAPDMRLHQDDHFYSQHEFTLVVNATQKHWDRPRISYQEITHLAFPEPPPPGVVITYTVEYEQGPRQNSEGSMTPGDRVRVKEGMIFSVTETGRS